MVATQIFGANTWARVHDGTTFTADSTIYVGNNGGEVINSALRYPNVTVAQGATIALARLIIPELAGAGSFLSNIYGIDEDDHTFPTDVSEWATDHSNHTSASATWDAAHSTTRYSVDVTSIVQEIVDRGSWSSGNAMGFHIDDDGSSTNNYITMGQTTGHEWSGVSLEIVVGDYTVGRYNVADGQPQSWEAINPGDGDLIIAFVSNDGGDDQSTPTDWTALDGATDGTSVEMGAYYWVADGTETGVILTSESWVGVTGEEYIAIFFRFDAGMWHGTTAPELQRNRQSSGTADPPSLTPSGWSAGDEDTIWVVVVTRDDNDGFASLDSNYSATNVAWSGSSGFSGLEICSGWRVNAAASEDPGTCTHTGTGEEIISYTVGIRPAGAGGTPGTATIAVLSASLGIPAASAVGPGVPTPAATSAALTIPAVSAVGGTRSKPSEIAAVLSIPAVSTVGPAVSSPAASALTLSIPAVSAAGGAVAGPSQLGLSVALPQVSLVGGAVSGPATISAALAIPAASAVAAASSVAVSALVAALSIPQASPAGLGSVSPAVSDLTLILPSVSLVGGAVGVPAQIALSIVIPVASFAGPAVSDPTALTAALTIPSVTILGGGPQTVTPGALALAVVIPAAKIGQAGAVSPGALNLVVLYYAPDLVIPQAWKGLSSSGNRLPTHGGTSPIKLGGTGKPW